MWIGLGGSFCFMANVIRRMMRAEEVTVFLMYLATDRKVSASTQNQAKSALLFLYRDVLKVELPWLDVVIAAKATRRLPVVLTQTEASSQSTKELVRNNFPIGCMLAHY